MAEEIIAVLAKALEDPDGGVRERAVRELGEIDRGSLVEWTRSGLVSRDHQQVATAAGVAEAAGLTEVAAEVLGCAAALRPDERGPLVGALSSFGLDPAELVAVAGDVDANNRPDAIRLLWQVSGRSNIDFHGQVQLDIRYIERQTLGLDLEILARTLPAVVRTTGAA